MFIEFELETPKMILCEVVIYNSHEENHVSL